MRHRSTPSNLAINMGSRSQSNENFSVSEFQQNLSMLEQDWQQPLGTPSSITSSLFDVCHCCGKQDCENLEYMKKLESDTRLAAEIGQSLLLKHETFVTKSNEQRIELEKQLEESHQRLSSLEQLLDEVENQKVTISKERNKCFREYQKREKILNETLSDLEIVNEKYNQLSIELDQKTTELEKLRVFKFMVRNAEIREETLTSKLDDTKQELSLCRKNELVLESKIKKLKMRYESLFSSHEQLSRDIEEKMEQTLKINTVDPIKSVSSNSNHSNDTNDLISLIKELSSSNTKLKSELLSCKDQLSDARGEITALLQKLDDYETRSEEQSKVTLQDDLMRKSVSCSTTLDLKKDKKKSSTIKRAASVMEKVPNTKKKNKIPLQQPQQQQPQQQQQQPPLSVSSSMPTMMAGLSTSSPSSSSSAIVHHHYHYYVKNSKGERVRVTDETESNSSNEFSGSDLMDCCDSSEKNDLYSAVMMDMGMQNNSRELVISPSTSSVMTIKDNNNNTQQQQSPYLLLQRYVTQLLEKLRESDILVLNRKLKRAFDMIELSKKSNNVIENILLEIETLTSRFLWIKSPLIDDVHMIGFFPILEIFREMLKELGILRTTMNDLQSEYVKKVQENEVRVEEEIIKKRTIMMKRQLEVQERKSSSSLGWITSIFQKSSTKSTDDGYSTLTKTTTNSSTLLIQPDEEDVIKRRSNTFDKRRQIPPPPPPPITLSNTNNGSSRTSHAIPIRTKRSLHRLHIDYEGIGPASIRHIPSDHPEWKAVNFSSSWLGGK